MRLLLELSMECESLSRAEAVSAALAVGSVAEPVSAGEGVLVLDTDADPEALAARLGLCHKVSEWFGSVTSDGVEALVESMDVPGPIRVRSTRVGERHRDVDLASVSYRVGAQIGRGRGVDLHSPASEVRIVYSEMVHVGRLIASIDRASYEFRMNKRLPFHCPVSLHPKFARALVNLTRVRRGGSVLDPFCGTGAILAEAFLAGLEAKGTDISGRMIEGARANLAHVGARATLQACDIGSVGDVVGKVDAVVTDPPYGRSTSTNGEPLDELYERSFPAFSDVLRRGSRLAVAVPDMSAMDSAEGFRLLESHSLRVHRSLTRNFCVLERL